MKDLRERCLALCIRTSWDLQHDATLIEEFAREIRNEALEDAAKHLEKVSESYASSDIRSSLLFQADALRTFKTDALAEEVKGDR